jgi:DNA polymerase III epsilon subunit-like protein
MVKDAPSFMTFLPRIQQFFLGETTLLAHNINYDVGVLSGEIYLTGKNNKFPWPPDHICSLQAAEPMFGKLTSLSNIYEHVMKEPLTGAHRAMNDVEALIRCLPWFTQEGLL